ncbi:MAG: enoyl-CoA hydratase-related protein [Solirubrobacteraceae bacterium]
MPELERRDGVFVLHLDEDENRFNPDWVGHVGGLLDEVQAEPGAPLVTAGRGKFFSNGLDLDWFAANPDAVASFLPQVHGLLARMLSFPAPTLAAIQGHAFAAGAMFALAHDTRLMRGDRGFFCLPEVDIRIPFTPGMTALLAARLTPQSANEAMTTGHRYGGDAACAAGIVQQACTAEDLLPAAVERAGALAGKDPGTLSAIKERLYAAPLAVLRDAQLNSF